ncbi:MAG: pilus assembly FimT family protein [Candidatus Saccharimonadales bacterium]
MRKKRPGFSAVELIIILFVAALLVVVGWVIFSKNNNKNHMVYTSYSDCISHGGQILTYDDAIQFSACKDNNNNLYLQYSAQNLPRIDQNANTTIPNQVIASPTDTSDLINYLTYNFTGCNQGKNSSVTGYFKIVKEIPSGWALLNYGCTNDTSAQKASTFMIAMKLSSGWVEISPTNNFLSNGTPSCLMVDMFRIPGDLTSHCYQNTGYNDGSLRTDSNS